jgi:hypothetical protein
MADEQVGAGVQEEGGPGVAQVEPGPVETGPPTGASGRGVGFLLLKRQRGFTLLRRGTA